MIRVLALSFLSPTGGRHSNMKTWLFSGAVSANNRCITASLTVSGSVFDIDRFSAAFRLLVEAKKEQLHDCNWRCTLYPTLSATYYSPRLNDGPASMRSCAQLPVCSLQAITDPVNSLILLTTHNETPTSLHKATRHGAQPPLHGLNKRRPRRLLIIWQSPKR